MKNILERRTKEQVDLVLTGILAMPKEEALKSLQALLEVETKTAFKAGMMQLNVLENTVNPNALNPSLSGKSLWTKDLDGAIELGAWKVLPELYQQHKGLV